MHYPDFFDEVPAISLHEPLGSFLGAFTDDEMQISYLDCVKLAGHSCPTVASAYLMAQYGLQRLYPDTLPRRSEISVEMSAPKEEGVTGVIANTISYIVGAGDEGGFKGMGGVFSRNNLLSFANPIKGTVKLTRKDTGTSVTLSCDTKSVPGSPEMMPLMQKALQGNASEEEKTDFQALWQSRVKAMLLDKTLQTKIITID